MSDTAHTHRPVARAWPALLAAFLLLAAGPLRAADAPAPEALVRQTTDQVLAQLKTRQAELHKAPSKVEGLIMHIVAPHFDFERMSRWVLGRAWRTATPAQRARFVSEFTDLLVRTYGSALLNYTDQTIVYLPFHMAPGSTDVTVRTQVEQGGGAPAIPIFYSMEQHDGEWLVYDVSIDGVSLVANYRSTFSQEVRENGLDALIERLAAHNREGRGGP